MKRNLTDRFGVLVEIAGITSFSRCAYWGHVSHFKREINVAEYAEECRDEMSKGCGTCTACQENGDKFEPWFDWEVMWPQPGMECFRDCHGKAASQHEVTCPLYVL